MKWLLRVIYKDGSKQTLEFDGYLELENRQSELQTPECTAVRFEVYKLDQVTELVTAWKTTNI